MKEELLGLSRLPTNFLKVGPVDGVDLMNWHAIMVGPEGSSYQGKMFHLDINFPENYPVGPPKIKFKS